MREEDSKSKGEKERGGMEIERRHRGREEEVERE